MEVAVAYNARGLGFDHYLVKMSYSSLSHRYKVLEGHQTQFNLRDLVLPIGKKILAMTTA